MAKKVKTFISPGVFTSEIDESYLGPGVGQIGAAIIGTAQHGPAFVPVAVKNFNEYAEYFGDLDEDYYMGYAARSYLKNAGVANIVRVLGPSGRTANGTAVTPGYTADGLWAISSFTGTLSADEADDRMYLHAIIETSGTVDVKIDKLAHDNSLFMVLISSSDDTTSYVSATGSMLTSSDNYIGKILNTDPTQIREKGHYLREIFDYNYHHLGGNGHAIDWRSGSINLTAFTDGYNSGSSPWVISQIFGDQEYELFRMHTLGHGVAENGRFKISIKNVSVSPIPSIDEHGSFDLEVRSFSDTDKSPVVLERFPGLSLDPTSNNYILRRVGDRHWKWNQTKEKMVSYGNYSNVSKYFWVEMTTGSIPEAALPWGFEGLVKSDMMAPSASDDGTDMLVMSSTLPYVGDLYDKETQSDVKSYIHWGVEFELSGCVKGRFTRFGTMTGSDDNFTLRFISGSTGTGTPAAGLGTTGTGFVYNVSNPVASQKAPGNSSGHTTIEPKYAQFTMPVAFGDDGWDPTLADPLDNVTQLASVSQIGVQALRQAVDIISDPDFIDINLVAIPGIYATKVVDYTIDEIEKRADAFYVAEFINHTSSATTVSTAVTEAKNRGYDSNYAALYYPGIKVVDDVNNKVIELPASIAALGAIAYNDRIAEAWFAPAGLNRGGLSQDSIGFQTTEAIDRLTADERDDLYENRVNPIASFPGEGVAIWGQKTLQNKASALDRINIRRLLIRAKKLISSATKFLVFEQNNASTWTRFKQLVNPILSEIQRKNGLEAFRIVMDETTNTPDIIDRNIMAAKLFLKPTRTAEFIQLDFIITRSGASFED